MSIVDELEKLGKLKEQGILTQEEFDQAKRKIINPQSEKKVPKSSSDFTHSSHSRSYTHRSHPSRNNFRDITERDSSIGNAANRYVTFQIVMGIIGVILFLIVASKMFSSGPKFSNSPKFPSGIKFNNF